MYAKIEPVVYRSGQAKCLVIRSASVQLGNRAIVEWSLMGEQGVDRKDYESGGNQMSSEEYSQWGQDDSYVYTWLATALNLNLISVEEGDYWGSLPVPPPPPTS